MTTVTLKGNTVNLKGELPAPGQDAPDFKFVKADLSEGSLHALKGKAKVILAVPSLDTGVCAMETKRFNQELSKRSDAVGLVISMDLPFAMKRFCETEGVANIVTGSDFRSHEFTNTYNTLLTSGPLAGLSARAVFVLNADNKIAYTELVPEITTEPDYAGVLAAVDALI